MFISLPLLLIIIVIAWVIYSRKVSSYPAQKEFAKSEGFYQSVQQYLDKEFKSLQAPYSQDAPLWVLSEKGYYEHRNGIRGQYELNKLWRRHILTILSSDKFSSQAKKNAVNAWSDYVAANYWFDKLGDDIEAGTTERGDIETGADNKGEAYSNLAAVMEGCGYNLEKETEQMKTRIDREYPIKSKKVKKI